MNDTSPKIARMVADRHRRMSPEQHMQAASSLFDAAQAIVESSLPAGLSMSDRRLASAKRLYGSELPVAAMTAFSEWPGHYPVSPDQES